MSLRVIAGTARGRKLKSVPGNSTRPIMDRVKEALFSILGSFVANSRFLDLFGGTGSVGIEALSRGAAHATFCELDRVALGILRDNLQHTQLDDRAEVLAIDAFDFLRRPAQTPFDYIYIAPPQYKGLWLEALKLLDANPNLLDVDGIAIVQIHPREKETIELAHFAAYDERRYGNTLLWFFERRDAPSS
ncbi:16S rRNA (guanine(966)-N(2))-methyltransferase RsmD [Aggregatilineales bacterium SYSU G02658]